MGSFSPAFSFPSRFAHTVGVSPLLFVIPKTALLMCVPPQSNSRHTSNRLREAQGPAIRRSAIGMDPRMYFKFPVNYK